MINKLIPIVNRFIPFTLVLLCAISFILPSTAFASTQYYYYSSYAWGGLSLEYPLTTVSSVGTASLDGINDQVARVNSIGTTTTPDIHVTNIHDYGSSGGPYSIDATADLAGQPAGNYIIMGKDSGNPYFGYCFFTWDGSAGDFTHCGTPPATPDACDSGDTRICGFTPENNSVVTGPDVDFTFDAWLAAADLGPGERIKVRLHNIDQNVLLLGFLSNNDTYIINRTFIPGEDGHYSYSTTTPLADGNYRLEAWIEKTIFFGWIKNPFDSTQDQVISKQFIVGTSTLIGNLTQNGFNILNGTLVGESATSSLALVAQCNPLGAYGFNMVNCLAGLFIPDSAQVSATIQGMRDGILTRLPWGYFTRFATILGSTATTSLPSYTVEFAQNTAGDTTTLAFDPGDMLAGGGALVDSIHDPYNNKTLKDIFEPIVQLVVALLVLFTIVSDLTGSHKDSASSPGDIASKRRRT